MEENLEKWLQEGYGGWWIAYYVNPQSEALESEVAAMFLWALNEYNNDFKETLEGLLYNRYPDKSPIEISNKACIVVTDAYFNDPQHPEIPYRVTIKSTTPLALGLYILELERHDAYAYNDVVPTKQSINNQTMAALIEAYKKMAEESLAKQKTAMPAKGFPPF